jgi:hypothetical protein
MSTTVRTGTTKTAPTDSLRKTALIAGTFYLITFTASIPALPLLDPVLHNPNFILGSGSDTGVLLGCLLDLVTALAGIGSAVALYPVVKRHGQARALGFVTTRMFEAAVIMIGVMSLLAVVTLRKDHAGATGADATSLVIAGQSLVAVRDWTFLLGPSLMAALNAVLLGSLMYRSRLVPRIIPTMGLIGAPLLIAATTATFFGLTEQFTVWSSVATLPVAAWELSVGGWMVAKGFKPSPVTAAGVPSSADHQMQPVA